MQYSNSNNNNKKNKKYYFYSLWSLLLLSLVSCSLGDNHDSCTGWADAGECEKNPGFMLRECAESCQRLIELEAEQQARVAAIDSFFDLSANNLAGEPIDFHQFRGKVTVITNVASYCGYTESHYRGLVELYATLQTEPVTILAFPCNQFGQQEPGSASDIMEFAKRKGVTFTMMEKINVNGPNTSLIYLFLKHRAEQGPVGNIAWNFATYFVVGPDGQVSAYNGVEPMQLKDDILSLLGKEEL